MNAEVKKKWTEALRSEQWKQGTDALRTRDEFCGRDEFCCLGVLCDLHAKETGEHWSENGFYMGEGTLLPLAVSQWAGLDYTSPYVCTNSGRQLLTELNDSGHFDFKRLAELIEKDPDI